jgi:hypothetical protein
VWHGDGHEPCPSGHRQRELAGCPCGHSFQGDTAAVVRRVKFWIAVGATALVTGCANGSDGLTGPSPLATATPSVPSSCAVPDVPRDLSATVSGSSVSLSWSAVGDATDYVVAVGKTPSSFDDTLMTSTPDLSYAIEDMTPGTHFARVHAHNWCGSSDASDAAEFTIQ